MKVRDIMKPARWTLGPDDSLDHAERLMARRRLHQLLVVDGGTLVGLLAERDVLAFRAAATDDEWWSLPVRHAMQPPPATTHPEDTVPRAIDRLARSSVDVLPVVEDGILIGAITATDLFGAERPRRAAKAVTVADAMTEHVVCVRPTDTLLDAAKLMVDHQVRHLPVVENEVIVGMLSDRDVRTIAGDPVRYAHTGSGDVPIPSVRDAMAPGVLTIRADRPLRELAHTLADEKIGALPIVDADGKLVGIVSYVDALRALAA